ncbi:MAG TPA: hypothetical protein VKP88_04540 [Candidatus Paceibacterota bacterium]|nr:hypothetical protein [Candidatus Paceibacterota bacterium]
MQLGAATLGETTVGFSSTLVDLSLDGSTTSTAEFLGEKAVDLTLSPTSSGIYTGTASIGRQVAQSATTTSTFVGSQTLGQSVATTPTATGTLSFAPTTTGVDVSATLSSITFGDFGSTQGKLLVNMSTVDTTGITFNSTLGSNLAIDGATTSPTTFNSSLGAFFGIDAATTATLSQSITQGRLVSIQPVSQTVGETSLGETTLGLVDQNARVISNLFSTVNKGRTVALDAVSESNLTVFRKVNLVLSSLAQSSSDWVVTKGVEVRFDSQTDTTLVLVPDFDEIIGKSRADGTQQQIVRSNGERIFILEAEGQID